MLAAEDLSRVVKKRRVLIKKFNNRKAKKLKASDSLDDSDLESESLAVVKKCRDDGDLKHFEERYRYQLYFTILVTFFLFIMT